MATYILAAGNKSQSAFERNPDEHITEVGEMVLEASQSAFERNPDEH
nr:hypothetical protein [Oharaeibacter diazotrophicus]